MKRILLPILLCGILASCTESTHFTIKGTLDSSFYGDAVYLCTIPDADTIATGLFTDSTSFIVEGGSSDAFCGVPQKFLAKDDPDIRPGKGKG